MPTYDYHCSANGATLAVRHRIGETVSTWGELCAVGAVTPGDTPADAPVHKVLSASNVVRRANLGSGAAPMAGCGSGACGGGTCQFG